MEPQRPKMDFWNISRFFVFFRISSRQGPMASQISQHLVKRVHSKPEGTPFLLERGPGRWCWLDSPLLQQCPSNKVQLPYRVLNTKKVQDLPKVACCENQWLFGSAEVSMLFKGIRVGAQLIEGWNYRYGRLFVGCNWLVSCLGYMGLENLPMWLTFQRIFKVW